MASSSPTVALLIVDMINRLDFPQGKQLLKHAAPAAKRIARLKQRFAAAGAPIIYANDNFGEWHADFRALVAGCREPTCLGAPLSDLLPPQPDDYYVLKPKHSAFHATPLDVLLGQCSINELVITGISTDVCVACTAMDAYMRDYRVRIPMDCVAAPTQARSARALAMLKTSLDLSTSLSSGIRL